MKKLFRIAPVVVLVAASLELPVFEDINHPLSILNTNGAVG